MMRYPGVLERVIHEIDTALRTLCVPSQRMSTRANPGASFPDARLNNQEKQTVAGLMRVNHAGEVCAQALYQGQALTAKLPQVRAQMTHAANEEIEHLAWCETRLRELGSAPSVLNPLWYSGSFMIGALAGLIGDKWSLGFVAETERQVAAHLAHHLNHLPAHDQKTKAILKQMQTDEATHAESATAAGGAPLPAAIRTLMQAISKIMTTSSRRI